MIKARYQKMYTEKYKQDMDFVIIGDYYLGPFIDMDVAQKAVNAINKQLTPQPNRTEIEYEHIGFHKCHEAIFKHEMEEKLYRKSSSGFVEADLTYIANNGSNGLYRQIEVEVDWRDEVESNLDFIDFDKGCNSIYLRTWPPIKEQQFLEMCRVTLRATGELE